MSRVGKAPIRVPSGVDVKISGDHVAVKGPQGELQHTAPVGIDVATGEDEQGAVVTVTRADDTRQQRSLHGLTRSLVANMVEGVSTGFSKELQIVGVGYRAASRGPAAIELALGFSHPVSVDAPDGIRFEVPNPTTITVSGVDKQLVGQVAANIRALRKPEPYKGKGIRYAGEHVIRKAGKAAK